MIIWDLIVDPWEFPISKKQLRANQQNRAIATIFATPESAKETVLVGETEAEKQRRWHHERWVWPSGDETDQPFPRDYPLPPDFDPPERDYETWERTRPDWHDDFYYSEDYYEGHDPEADFLEEWSRALSG